MMKNLLPGIEAKPAAFQSGYGVGLLSLGTDEANPFDPDDARRADWLAGYDAGCTDALTATPAGEKSTRSARLSRRSAVALRHVLNLAGETGKLEPITERMLCALLEQPAAQDSVDGVMRGRGTSR